MKKINEYYINTNNIAFFEIGESDTDGYTWQHTYHIFIYFIGSDEKQIHLKTYDKEQFNKWVEELE